MAFKFNGVYYWSESAANPSQDEHVVWGLTMARKRHSRNECWRWIFSPCCRRNKLRAYGRLEMVDWWCIDGRCVHGLWFEPLVISQFKIFSKGGQPSTNEDSWVWAHNWSVLAEFHLMYRSLCLSDSDAVTQSLVSAVSSIFHPSWIRCNWFRILWK